MPYRIFLLLIVCIASPILAKPIHFESTPSTRLIELFTSQGCSSCPIAERWLNKFEDDPRLWKEVVPVAFHVDYWDQLGWKDIYASPTFSKRQRQYRSNSNIRSVYTPGFIVDGYEWRGFYYKTSLPQPDNKGAITGQFNEGVLSINYHPNEHNKTKPDNTLNVAILGVGIKTHIKKGENAHRKLKQNFVVLEHNQLANLDNQWEIPIDVNNFIGTPRLAIAVWMQDNTSLQILQSAGTWLNTPQQNQ